ncbi:hypothetical protein [Lentilactobacillus kisonensis]|uniref:hypothetical protein n=1 Tax=Lentilactobacillus kisonensis TaxID=481722 RepID=UPI000B200051
MIIGKSKLKIIILSVFTLIFSFSLLGGIKASASSTIILIFPNGRANLAIRRWRI